MSRARLLMLHDSPQFGGHEVMLLNLLPGVIEAGHFDEIVACFPEGNSRLAEGLTALQHPIRLRPWRFEKRRAEPYLGYFRRDYAKAARDIIAIEQPETTLLVQGRIENLVVPMMAIPRDRFIVSYVPMAHPLADMGRNGRVGDAARRRLYRRPDRFVVPSRSVASQIAAVGGTSEVVVVDNFVTMPAAPSQEEARRVLDLPDGRRVALFLGRLDTAQKGLDTLTQALREHSGRLRDWLFLFIGDGEGRAAIEALAADQSLGLDIRTVPWTDKAHVYLAAADLLLMPSRWEGVPLVMLESMACGTPILASDIDVFREYLPAECRVDFSAADLPARMQQLATSEARARFGDAVAGRDGAAARERARARFAAALVPGKVQLEGST